MVDYPDGTLPIAVLVQAELMSQMRQLPWWLRYAPSRIIFLDDFEGVNKWAESDPLIAKDSSVYVYEGTYNLKITPPDVSESITAEYRIPYYGKSKFMLQLLWSVGVPTDMAYVQFLLKLFDGVHAIYAQVRFVIKNAAGDYVEIWQYYDKDGNWIDIADSYASASVHYQNNNHFMLKIDLSEGANTFIKMISNNKEFDLSGIDLYSEDDASSKALFIIITAEHTSVGPVKSAYIDALCLSDQE